MPDQLRRRRDVRSVVLMGAYFGAASPAVLGHGLRVRAEPRLYPPEPASVRNAVEFEIQQWGRRS